MSHGCLTRLSSGDPTIPGMGDSHRFQGAAVAPGTDADAAVPGREARGFALLTGREAAGMVAAALLGAQPRRRRCRRPIRRSPLPQATEVTATSAA
jgi:hypothetical protein